MSTYALQVLRNVGVSERLSYKIIPQLKIKSHEACEVLWPKGVEIDSWQLVMSGLVAGSAPSVGSEIPTPIMIYGHHSWFGEQPILNRRPSYLEYVCLTPTQTIGMPASVLWEIFESEPAFARFIAKLMAWRVQRTSEMLMLMKMGNPCLRVVMGLALFAEAMAYQSSRPPTDFVDGGVEIPVTQGMLASLCGVSRTLFSEFVQELAANRWLTISYGKMEIMSLPTWRKFANNRRDQRMNNLNPTIDGLVLELYRASVA